MRPMKNAAARSVPDAKSGVARFSSGMSQAGASGRPVGARGQRHEKTSVVRGAESSMNAVAERGATACVACPSTGC